MREEAPGSINRHTGENHHHRKNSRDKKLDREFYFLCFYFFVLFCFFFLKGIVGSSLLVSRWSHVATDRSQKGLHLRRSYARTEGAQLDNLKGQTTRGLSTVGTTGWTTLWGSVPGSLVSWRGGSIGRSLSHRLSLLTLQTTDL